MGKFTAYVFTLLPNNKESLETPAPLDIFEITQNVNGKPRQNYYFAWNY